LKAVYTSTIKAISKTLVKIFAPAALVIAFKKVVSATAYAPFIEKYFIGSSTASAKSPFFFISFSSSDINSN